jgi:hypothetical protein
VLGRTLAKATLSSLMAKRTSPPKWWDKFVAGYVQALKRRTE